MEEMQTYSRRHLAAALVLSAMMGLMFGFAAGIAAPLLGLPGKVGGMLGMSQTERQNDSLVASSADEPPAGEESLEDMLERTTPAVVSIVISKDVPIIEQVMTNPFGGNDFFSQFFGNSFSVPQYRQNGTEKQEVGAGTGFFVSADGYVITNRHVVADEDAEYTVILDDETKFTATVLARDTVNEVAVLKVEPMAGQVFPFLSLGDSDGVRVGQSVVAVGYALGQYDNSVSSGIVSGLRRNITAGDGHGKAESLYDVIQTDAAINPGNSGGPLLNRKGEVIGVNVAVDGSAQNISFSLPINEVNRAYKSVLTSGTISRPWLGVRYLMINEDFAKENSLSVDYGALVARGEKATDIAVIPGSPADKAGIVENDIILEFAGEKLTEDYPLALAANRHGVGEVIKLKVLHRGEEKEISITLEERKAN